MTKRIKCTLCNNMILAQTADDNIGLCAPCFKKANPTPRREKPSRLPYETLSQLPVSQLDEKQKRLQLEDAISLGDASRIDELLAENTDFLQRPPSQTSTWIGEAISRGCNLEILKKLVSAGCDPHTGSKSPDQTTPLEVAVRTEQLATIEWLLNVGVNPNIGRPIVAAINFRIPPDVQIGMLALLINAGADVNRSFALYGDEEERFTILDWALSYESSPSTIEFLRNHGAKTSKELAL